MTTTPYHVLRLMDGPDCPRCLQLATTAPGDPDRLVLVNGVLASRCPDRSELAREERTS